jgi:hypothetical protein
MYAGKYTAPICLIKACFGAAAAFCAAVANMALAAPMLASHGIQFYLQLQRMAYTHAVL